MDADETPIPSDDPQPSAQNRGFADHESRGDTSSSNSDGLAATADRLSPLGHVSSNTVQRVDVINIGEERSLPSPLTSENLWGLYPGLHEAVATVFRPTGLDLKFKTIDDPRETWMLRSALTKVPARFECLEPSCAATVRSNRRSWQRTVPKYHWRSAAVKVDVRLYAGNKYNARAYYQHCKHCNRVREPIFDGKYEALYVARISERIAEWTEVKVKLPSTNYESSGGGHRTDLCEGCKHGVCHERRSGHWDWA